MDFSAERKIMREKQQSCVCNYESTRSFQQMKISSETSSSTSHRLFSVLVREHTREYTPWSQLLPKWRENIFSSLWGRICSVWGVKLGEYQWRTEEKSYLICETPLMAHIHTLKTQTGSHALFIHKAGALIHTRESLHYPHSTPWHLLFWTCSSSSP